MTDNGQTLAEFLEARISEDEAVAFAAYSASGRREWTIDLLVHMPAEEAAAEHVARHDPGRVLAECEAKRRITELHGAQESLVEWFDAPETGRADVCNSCHPAEPTPWNPPVGQAGIRPDGFVASYVLAPCPTMRYLALPYASHPGYRPEWRPE